MPSASATNRVGRDQGRHRVYAAISHSIDKLLRISPVGARHGVRAENNLQFLGFEIELNVRRHYARQFPGDVAMTDLAQWHRFEMDNPGTFIKMYQFWMQKKSS